MWKILYKIIFALFIIKMLIHYFMLIQSLGISCMNPIRPKSQKICMLWQICQHAFSNEQKCPLNLGYKNGAWTIFLQNWSFQNKITCSMICKITLLASYIYKKGKNNIVVCSQNFNKEKILTNICKWVLQCNYLIQVKCSICICPASI